MPDNDRTLDLVRKLLAKAENPACTPAEAEALTAKAAELIARYGIDRAALAATDPTTDPAGRRDIICRPPYALDKAVLLARVSDPLRVRTVRQSIRTSSSIRMLLFGFTSDLDRTELLYTSLLVQASFGLASARPAGIVAWGRPSAAQVAAFRRSWLDGFGLAVHQRLTDAEVRARHEYETSRGSGMELVLADRGGAIEALLTQEFPKLRNAPRRTLSGHGQDSGYVAGQRADLGTPGLTTNPT